VCVFFLGLRFLRLNYYRTEERAKRMFSYPLFYFINKNAAERRISKFFVSEA